MEEEPLKSVRSPNALVRLSSPNKSTSTIEVKDMYAAEKIITMIPKMGEISILPTKNPKLRATVTKPA